MKKLTIKAFLLSNSLLLVACGGGAGGGDSSRSNPVKQTTAEVNEEKRQLQDSSHKVQLSASKVAGVIESASRSESDPEMTEKLFSIEEKRQRIVAINAELSKVLQGMPQEGGEQTDQLKPLRKSKYL